MGIQHHRSEEQQAAQDRLLNELLGKAVRSYPDRRVGHDDEGETAFAIAVDPQFSIVRIQFSKPMLWLGLDVKSARQLAEMLTAKADELEAAGRS